MFSMKTINMSKSLLVLIVTVIAFSGCKKDLQFSKATYWPLIKVIGPDYVVVPVGTGYTDSSADVSVNSKPISFTTTSTVDTATTGVYTVVYSAVNEDGISASQTRTVVVVNTAAAADDLTGTYQRTNGANPKTNWAKDPDRPYAYLANNPGGVNNDPAFDATFSVYNVEPGVVVVPLQTVGSLAPFFCSASLGGSTKISFNVSAAVGDVAYAWVLNGANFGTVLRTFIKR